MRWFIIGAGNVAWHLAQMLEEVGELCIGTASRQATSILPTLPAYSLHSLPTEASQEADIFLVAVSDDAIAEVCAYLQHLPPRMIVHTSGTRPLQALQTLAEKGWKTGIFYPLQTISKTKKIDWKKVPILLESEDLPTLQAIEAVGKRISTIVLEVDSEKRAWLHLVAVMTANFLHHLCVVGNEILEKQNLSLYLLQPLLEETLQKAILPQAVQTQTGPAKRKDTQTIAKHLTLLEEFPAYKAIYQTLTDSILNMYPQN